MGDLLMSGPAIRALKETFNCKITVLTSAMAAGIARLMDEVDDVITYDLPWVKHDKVFDDILFFDIVRQLKSRDFDAAVIFTVYSQNPLPAVMLAYLAGIPNRLAYCRENPYQLLTNWVADDEPYNRIRHQVRRDMDLVATVGAVVSDERLFLKTNDDLWLGIQNKLDTMGFDSDKKWLILHPGVSEVKREYPINLWAEAGKKIINDMGYQLIITGSGSDKHLIDDLQQRIGEGSFAVGGLFDLNEFITLISKCPVVVSVNTGTVHIAAALGIPVVVLYALTNPQHTPWMVPSKVLPFPVPQGIQSKNEVIKYVNSYMYNHEIDMPTAQDILDALRDVLSYAAPVNQHILFPRANQISSSV